MTDWLSYLPAPQNWGASVATACVFAVLLLGVCVWAALVVQRDNRVEQDGADQLADADCWPVDVLSHGRGE